MRILQVTETLAAGGAETFVLRLSNALAAVGHEVVLAVMVPNVHPALAAAIDPRVQVEYAPARGTRWLWRAEKALRVLSLSYRPQHRRQLAWLSGVVDRFRPDVIHSHLLKADLLAMDIRGANGVPAHVVTVHGDYPMFLEGKADPFLRELDRHVAAVADTADAIVGVAEPHLRLFHDQFAVEKSRLHLIYNGLEEPPADGPSRSDLGLPEHTFLFGMIARGIEGKGWREALKAFSALGRCDAALVLVGEGPFLDRLRAEGVPQNVIFAGFAARPVHWIQQFDCGLMPSQIPHESLPTVIIEYLACGKPVIATDVGEVRAMLTTPDGKMAGDLVPQRAVEPLADAMQRMLSDSSHRTACAGRARKAFAKFAMATCLSRYERLFEDVVSNSSIRARH